VTLDQIDSELAVWKKSLAAAAQNLMDLYSLPTYQRLAGSNGVPKADLKGVSAARVYPALASVAKMFGIFDDLQCTIDRASELRQRINPIFASDSKLREIEDLLHGKSVKLPLDPVPIGQRTLASSADIVESVTPAELMGAMARSFTAARDVVLSVDGAWHKLGMALDQTMSEIATFRREAEQWKTSFPALANAEAAMETIHTRIENDPLACAEEFDSGVEPVLRQARNALARIRAQHDQLSRALVDARKLMNQLEDVHKESLASWNNRRLKITGVAEPPAPQDEQAIQALGDWLQRLEKKFNEGMLEPILVGLGKWNKSANDCVFHERAALNANQSPINERNELRGRLEALKAKARARGSAEHPDLTRIANEAAKLLFNRPTPIDKASALLVDYERVLRTLTT
jgi:hypothetical protein